MYAMVRNRKECQNPIDGLLHRTDLRVQAEVGGPKTHVEDVH